MKKPYITSIEKNKNGAYIVKYFDGYDHNKRMFLFYTKKSALKAVKDELGIRRNSQPIYDLGII